MRPLSQLGAIVTWNFPLARFTRRVNEKVYEDFGTRVVSEFRACSSLIFGAAFGTALRVLVLVDELDPKGLDRCKRLYRSSWVRCERFVIRFTVYHPGAYPAVRIGSMTVWPVVLNAAQTVKLTARQ